MNNFMVFLDFASFMAGAWEIIKNILIFVVVLGLIVGIHEFGHFVFARRAKILCREFAIGMGPKLAKKRKGETVYSLRAFPIGGFCAIAGEEVEEDPFKDVKKIKLNIVEGIIKGFYLDVDNNMVDYPIYEIVSYDIFDANQTGNLFMEVINSDETEAITTTYKVDPQAIIYQKKEEFQIAPFNRTMASKNKRQRALVMFGGPLMNFLLAILVFLIVGLCTGFADTSSTELGTVSSNSTVYSTLQDGDRITSFETNTLGYKEFSSWTDLSNYMTEYDEKYLSESINITAYRDDVKIITKISPFIGINSAGFGSGYNYNIDGITKVEVYENITQEGIADNSLLQVNDIIKEIWVHNGTHIIDPSWTDIRKVFDDYVGGSDNEDENKVFMNVLRGEEEIEINIIPYSKKLLENQTTLSGQKIDPTSSSIGISPKFKFSLIKSIGYSFERTWGSFTAVIDTLKLLFGGTVSIKNLSGPIGIYSITSNAAQYGILYLLSLIGLLSVNIGFMNLLPIPALDGGRLVFVAYEAITKKKPNPKVETILITITMILLFGLMIFVAYEDIMRLLH